MSTHNDLHSEQGALPGEHPGRAKNPVVKGEDLAWLEFEKPDLDRAEADKYLWDETQRDWECWLARAEKAQRVREALEAATDSLEGCVDDTRAAVDSYVATYGENFRPQRLAYMRECVAKADAAIEGARAALKD